MPSDKFHILVVDEYFSITSSIISINSSSVMESVNPKSLSLFGMATISTNLKR